MVCRIKNRHTFKSLPILNSAYFTECWFVIRHITQTDTETETEANFTHWSPDPKTVTVKNVIFVIEKWAICHGKCNIHHGFYDSVKTMTQTQNLEISVPFVLNKSTTSSGPSGHCNIEVNISIGNLPKQLLFFFHSTHLQLDNLIKTGSQSGFSIGKDNETNSTLPHCLLNCIKWSQQFKFVPFSRVFFQPGKK